MQDNSVISLSAEWNLHQTLSKNLLKSGFKDFFAVQREVIPRLIANNRNASIISKDVCVSAPTGSGKTLSFAIPVIDTLLKQLDYENNGDHCSRLKALILLPSRELAQQVYDVIRLLIKDSQLKALVTNGSMEVSEERGHMCSSNSRKRLFFNGEESIYINSCKRQKLSADLINYSSYNRNESKVEIDILVSTPGRLIEHLQFTNGFSLKYLQFLVLDEADRLLGNAYHSWVRSLLASVQQNILEQIFSPAVEKTTSARWENIIFQETKNRPFQRVLFSATLTDDPASLALLGVKNPLFIKCDGHKNADVQSEIPALEYDEDRSEVDIDNDQYPSNLLSARLPDEDSYTLPSSLSEFKLITETSNRLHNLFAVMIDAFYSDVVINSDTHSSDRESECDQEQSRVPKRSNPLQGICAEKNSIALIFTSSVETSHRLSTFLKVLNGQLAEKEAKNVQHLHEDLGTATHGGLLFRGRVEEMTRLISHSEREKIIKAASQGEVAVIVCSDRLSRGMDLQGVKLVINYELPKHVKNYVHRAGRTARAQRKGSCLTLLRKGEIGVFKKMRSNIVSPGIENVKIVQISKLIREKLSKPCTEAIKMLHTRL